LALFEIRECQNPRGRPLLARFRLGHRQRFFFAVAEAYFDPTGRTSEAPSASPITNRIPHMSEKAGEFLKMIVMAADRLAGDVIAIRTPLCAASSRVGD
jgi:hypothetical protein